MAQGRRKEMLKVLVCGGRDFLDRSAVYAELNKLKSEVGDLFIIQGGARGADYLAGRWAIENGSAMAKIDANWLVYGKAAGPIRNTWMLELRPDLVLAFPGGVGTEGMIKSAEKVGVLTRKVGW